MNDALYEALTEYKKISEAIYDAVNFDNYDKLDELLEKRQMLIDNLKETAYTGEEFKSVCNDLDILKLEESISRLMSQRKENIKNHISRLKSGIAANNSYNKKNYTNSILFNKKY